MPSVSFRLFNPLLWDCRMLSHAGTGGRRWRIRVSRLPLAARQLAFAQKKNFRVAVSISFADVERPAQDGNQFQPLRWAPLPFPDLPQQFQSTLLVVCDVLEFDLQQIFD